MMQDDLPWPELGNVSRGATRGNQGHKGVLGQPNNEGCGVLQLRVQPGVLAVRLNRQTTEWYRLLDDEVKNALKLTKTYWRKARRRQDYDARADQDHMELHEWLQQLKDKVMTHLELLMQKGEIQGPPYIMGDHLELSFLRKFIERQAAGIPHNPRLRQAYLAGGSPRVPHYATLGSSQGSSTPASWVDDKDDSMEDQLQTPPPTADSQSPQTLLNNMHASQQTLRNARAVLTRAQRDTIEAFSRYKACLDAETRARQTVADAEERRDVFMTSLVDAYRGMGAEVPDMSSPGVGTSREAVGVSLSNTTAQTHFDHLQGQRSASSSMTKQDINDHWDHTQTSRPRSQSSAMASSVEPQTHEYDARFNGMNRKHSRSWETPQGQPTYEDACSFPPRKRHSIAEEYQRSPVFRYTAAFPSPALSRTSYSLHSSPVPPHSHLPGQLTV